VPHYSELDFKDMAVSLSTCAVFSVAAFSFHAFLVTGKKFCNNRMSRGGSNPQYLGAAPGGDRSTRTYNGGLGVKLPSGVQRQSP